MCADFSVFDVRNAVVDTGFVKTRFITPQTGVEMLKVRCCGNVTRSVR
jgi:hypothetical protein